MRRGEAAAQVTARPSAQHNLPDAPALRSRGFNPNFRVSDYLKLAAAAGLKWLDVADWSDDLVANQTERGGPLSR
jgi:hypothetical protein